jgi:basic membrane protein A
MKSIAVLMMMAIALFGLSACADEPEGLSIAIVTSLTGVDDRSFNQSNYEGIHAFLNAHAGHTVTHIYEPTGDEAAATRYMENIAGDFDVVVLPGFQFRHVAQAANDNPDTYFILIDTWPEGGYAFDNVRALQFAESESGFLAGIVAAKESESGYVAFIGGAPFPPLVNYQFGFESGVEFANLNFGTNVQVVNLPHRAGTDVRGINIYGNYAGTFSNPAVGSEITNELLDVGVDIIFVAAGGTGYGVYSAIRESDRSVGIIGIDTDHFEEDIPPHERLQITAVYKAVGLSVQRSLMTIIAGNFEGGNLIKRADTDSVGIVIAPGRHQLSTETINRVNELFGRLRDETIIPASNFNGFTPQNFPGLR